MPAQSEPAVNYSANQNHGRTWSIAASVLTAAVSVALLLLPSISTADSGGTAERQSLLERDGWAAALVLAVPVLVAAASLLTPTRRRRWATIGVAVLLALGALASVASVGLFYLPSVALLVVAAIRTPQPKPRSSTS